MYSICSENKDSDQCVVTTQVICAFVFAYAKSRFSHCASHMVFLRLCDKIDPDNTMDKAGFFANTAGNFEDVVQYNKDNRAFEVQFNLDMSLVMRKPAFCICEKKDADQLRSYREADQRLCFRYMDSTTPLLPKSEI